VDHPGEAARHHAAAGERSLAHEAALAAAAEEAPPGELAAHLEVAASCSDGADAQVLRQRAAALLVQVGRFAAAESLLDLVQSGSARVQAEVCLLRGRAAVGDHDLDRAGACFASGRALARSAGSPVALELEVEALALELELYADAVAATVLDAALDLPVPAAGSAAVPAALHALIGQARRLLGEPGWEDDTARSLAAARRAGATGDECRIAETTIGALFHEGAAPRARRLARTYRSRSAELRLASWERRFRTRAAWLSMHGGRYPHAHDEAERLLTEPLEWERFLVVYVAAESAVDLGLHDRASELLAELYVLSTSGHERLRQALWVRADVELWSGRPAAALATVDELLARFPHEQSTFARLTRAWACVETGVDPGSASIGPTVPLLAAAPTELLALSSLYRGEDEAAARLFADAASVWRGQHERGRLRCAWAAGEALRRAGRTDSALIQLERAERLVEAYRQRPILSRVHRSLRLLGARRSSERSAGRHGLTAREAEILGLVGEGRSNAEIARRLGLGRPTVDRLVASATGKLGARTRLQAAALAARP
jgi:DNA-binding CsgD family transcriptional regulator